MLINTHLILGDIIYSKTNDLTLLKLCKRKFLYGNIKPDIDKYYRSFYHSSEYALNQIEKILKIIKNNYITIEDFSEKLGMINHFVCDMFCSYHNNEKLDRTLIQHLLYETKLHFDIKTNTYEEKYIIDLNDNDICSGITDILKKMQKQYYELLPSAKKDINFSIMSGIYTSKLILSDCIDKYVNIYEFAS